MYNIVAGLAPLFLACVVLFGFNMCLLSIRDKEWTFIGAWLTLCSLAESYLLYVAVPMQEI